MGRIYRIPYSGTLALSGGNTDLLSIQPADDKPVRLIGWLIGQTSEVADAAEESLRITVQVFPATFTVGSGGSAVTGVPCDVIDVAAGFTARCNDTTVATTSGSAAVHEELAWNIRNSPWERYFPEEQRIVARQGAAIVVRLESTVADDIAANLTFLVEEF